ncbi:Uncharacterized protein PECH_003840 [Penicillium ucsense]|uniref:Apple domain-containing protein n=1 Tax=Penicillium ucsense TaxID=2839758 RepID=A0A8J8W3Q0_9EURO|nr:Uncharacterized protein PECM_005607 [Penicillium ucsense]KAF7737389.1 Uncharacterized protein PECH_003840 [Penicillium ucsense]
MLRLPGGPPGGSVPPGSGGPPGGGSGGPPGGGSGGPPGGGSGGPPGGSVSPGSGGPPGGGSGGPPGGGSGGPPGGGSGGPPGGGSGGPPGGSVPPGAGDKPKTIQPNCPQDDGKVYAAPDDSWFQLQCLWHDWRGVKIPGAPPKASSLQECVDRCSATEGCVAVNFGDLSGLLSGNCDMMAEHEGPGDTPCENHHFAYVVDPPVADVPDDNIPKCTTECPGANHRQYTGPYGQAFKMNCGKRHGTKYISVEEKASLEECMDACDSLTSCHSVDYNRRVKKCYLSTHQGEPTIDAPGFASAYGLGCAGACEKKCCNSKN